VRFKPSVLRQLISVEAVVAIAVIVTALAIWYQEPLTHRTLSFGPKDLGTSFYSYGYDDHPDGGHSKATVDQNRPLAFTCEIKPGFKYP